MNREEAKACGGEMGAAPCAGGRGDGASALMRGKGSAICVFAGSWGESVPGQVEFEEFVVEAADGVPHGVAGGYGCVLVVSGVGFAPVFGLLGVGSGGLAGLGGEGFGATNEGVEEVCDGAGVVDVIVEAVGAELGRMDGAVGVAAGVGGLDVGGDGQEHDGAAVGEQVAHLVDFVGECDAQLAGFEHFGVAGDHEFGLAFEDEEDFVAEVVAVESVDLARFHVIEAGADLRGCEYVLVDFAEIIDFEGHGVRSCDGLVWQGAGPGGPFPAPAKTCRPLFEPF